MINKVRLKNWKSHLDSELSFAAGTNGLVGIVGSGKTSILDAICFTLFGTFPALQSRKIKLEDVIMKKPSPKDYAEIEVWFHLNGKNYSAKRTIEKRKGTSYSEIRENGKVVESPSTKSVTSCVEKILKVNYELFSKAIYSEQNALDYFLTLGKGQRMKKIDELLMIHKFEKARANVVTLTNKIIERKIGKQSIIGQTDIEEIKKLIKDLKESIGEIVYEKSRLGAELVDIGKRKDELEREATELRNIKDNLEGLKRNESAVESALKETTEIIDNLESMLKTEQFDGSIDDELKECEKKIDELSSFLKKSQSEYENLQSQLARSKTKIEFLRRDKIEKLEKEFEGKIRIKREFEHLRDTTGENIEEQINAKRSTLERLIGEVGTMKSKVKELGDTLSRLSSAVGRCPICDSVLSEERKNILMNEKEREMKLLKEKIEDVRKNRQVTEEGIEYLRHAARKLDEMLAEIRDFDKIKGELENSRQLFVQHNKSVDKLSRQLNSIKAQIGATQEELQTTMNNKQKIAILSAQMGDYENRKSRLDELKKQRDELKKHLVETENKIAGREIKKTEEWLRNAIAKEREIETRISNYDNLVKERQSRVWEIEKSLEAAEREIKEIERLERLVKELKIFTRALQQTQIELRQEFIEAVNYTMNKLWPTLYPYQDFTGIRLGIEEGDYILQLQERTRNWINVDGVASGGERSIACLALRIAFALVLAPQLRLLVLDEPTSNLDVASIKVLATTLREGINEFIDQCFVITHNEALEEAITGSAYRLERDKAKDEATRIISI